MVVDDVEYILEPLENEQHLVAERKKPEDWPLDDLGNVILIIISFLSRISFILNLVLSMVKLF